MLHTALAKLLTLKVAAAAAVTVAATGGVALAANSGNLPSPLDDDKPTAGPSASASADADQTRDGTGDTVKPTTGAQGQGTGTGDHGAAASPAPSLVGLCRAYTAGAGDNPGKALENPAFTVLVTTAGGRDKVVSYCGALLAAEKPHGKAPTAKPDNGPTTRPTAKPAVPTKPEKPGAKPTHPNKH
jgi:hypothetical protein